MSKIEEIKQFIFLITKQIDILKSIQKVMMEIMVRQTCREKLLKRNEENLIVAVIKAESGMNPNAINKNDNQTIDYGLCQFNDYWYWTREKIISPDIALNNPKKAIEVMIDQYKKGRLNNWVTYQTGIYKKYL